MKKPIWGWQRAKKFLVLMKKRVPVVVDYVMRSSLREEILFQERFIEKEWLQCLYSGNISGWKSARKEPEVSKEELNGSKTLSFVKGWNKLLLYHSGLEQQRTGEIQIITMYNEPRAMKAKFWEFKGRVQLIYYNPFTFGSLL